MIAAGWKYIPDGRYCGRRIPTVRLRRYLCFFWNPWHEDWQVEHVDGTPSTVREYLQTCEQIGYLHPYAYDLGAFA